MAWPKIFPGKCIKWSLYYVYDTSETSNQQPG